MKNEEIIKILKNTGNSKVEFKSDEITVV